ncbi:murein transglycosylase A [Sphingomonas oryzagri]|uniref:peptidoglycan lytic exotransglycosylase n=1 Tax=Sphingomonas oryzagri TaxID=3042314 RepID=A0ABT6N028_9SPHN|nr:MltA domain-containing protein [Sphingomonas oryzagri]MDH7638664.1 MltA domain-containing protein [Sphingomonas oryzagri]
MRLRALAAATVSSLALASCVGPQGREARNLPPPPPSKPSQPYVPTTAKTAILAGVTRGPAVASLAIDPAKADTVLAAFRSSCAALLKRADGSGLTTAADWQPACTAAASWPQGQGVSFFQRYFETARIGQGALYATGYYEPQIQGSTTPQLGYDVPIYGPPDDMVSADLGQFMPELKGKTIRGKVQNGKLVPYPDRSQIQGGAINGHAPIIGYAADKIDFFFLQIQGSGQLRQPDGSIVRIGYAGQNGQPYTGIGKWMLAQGMLQPGQASMQGIVGWLRSHPDQADAVMDQNRSFVFFKYLNTPPVGALGVPVTGRVSVAADPAFTPLGAPVWLAPERAEAAGLWVAQDTGGAIKGANRFDTFWGAGADAARIAGGMSAHGSAYVLLPAGTIARLAGAGQIPQA